MYMKYNIFFIKPKLPIVFFLNLFFGIFRITESKSDVNIFKFTKFKMVNFRKSKISSSSLDSAKQNTQKKIF